MLQKKERLNREAFSRFFSVGRRYHSLSLVLTKVPGVPFQASAVAPKKHFKRAVDRNTFRRRIYEILRVHHKEHTLEGAFIFIAKKHQKNFDVLKTEVLELVSQSLKVR